MTPTLAPDPGPPPREQVMKAALRFLQLHAVTPRGDLTPELSGPAIEACAARLCERLRVAPDLAAEIAMLAWAELAGRQVRCYVDLQSSSPHLLFLVDPVAGVRHAIPVCDLVRMLGPRAVV